MNNTSRLASLRRLAYKNELEVQHFVRAAKGRVPGLVETLTNLCRECEWSDRPKLVGNTINPPFRLWAAVASSFVQGGYASLVTLGRRPKYRPIVTRMLVELHSRDALRIFLEISDKTLRNPGADKERADETTHTLALFSYPPVRASKANAERIREFLYAYLALPDADSYMGIRALAGFGDKQSIAFIQTQPPLESPYEHITGEVLHFIAKRTRTKLTLPPRLRLQTQTKMKTDEDMFAALVEAGTNGDNYDVSTEDIISHLKEWQKISSFTLSDLDYNQVTLNFTALPKDLDAFIKDAVEFCPDLIMDDEDAEIPSLKKQLVKTKKLGLWWD